MSKNTEEKPSNLIEYCDDIINISNPILEYDPKIIVNYQHPKCNSKVSKSYGIILCRQNMNGRIEVVLVHKKYTYYFVNFLFGAVDIDFSKMTLDELLDIWSLDYERMWSRVWGDRNKYNYEKNYTKFQNKYIKNDGGAKLKSIIRKTRHEGNLLWEVPKGKKNNNESDLETSIRELEEETGINKNKYNLINGVKRHITYINNNIKYINTYYIAFTDNKHIKKNNKFIDNIKEITEYDWFDIEKIKYLPNHKYINLLVSPIFKLIKRHIKGKRKVGFID